MIVSFAIIDSLSRFCEITRRLSISERTFRAWTADRRQQKDEEVRRSIYDLWLACHETSAIAEAVGMSERTVESQIADFRKNGNSSDLALFGNFTPEVYQVWNFAKATNEVRHFGNIPFF